MKTQSQNIEESFSQSTDVPSQIHWINIISLLWQSRKFIGIVTGVVTVLAIIISLILTETFRSSAVLLPDTEKSKIGSLGGMSDLAAMAGITVSGEVSLVKLYPLILKSESVLQNVIFAQYKTNQYSDSVNLIQYMRIKEKNAQREYEVALASLRSGMDVALDLKTGVVTIAIETEEPQLSADILNNVIRYSDKFIRTKRNTNALEQRKWIDTRLVEVKEDLSRAENTLKDFREKNRVIGSSPQLLLDQERFVREVQLNSTVYVELKKQYELAKIEEIRTTPIINVMDYARPAARKERPKRSMIVIMSMMLACLGSCAYKIIEQMYGKTLVAWYKSFRR